MSEIFLSRKSKLINVSSYVYISFAVLISACYAGFLSFIPVDIFMDRDNYLMYAKSYNVVYERYLESGFLNVMFNEPLWLLYNYLLSFIFDPEDVIRFTVFISAFISSFYVIKAKPNQFLILLFILIYPQVLIKYAVHLRQGLAISFFLLGFYSKNKSIKTAFISIAPFVHLSFFFVLLIYLFVLVQRKLNFDAYFVLLSVFLLGVFVSFFLPIVAPVLGARQADEYNFNMTNVSGLGFIFWVMIFALYSANNRFFLERNLFSATAIAFYLSTYFFIEVTGRIFESMLIVVFLSSLQLSKYRYCAFVMLFLSMFIYSFYKMLNLPWLGWLAR